MDEDCVFCKILSGELPVSMVYQDELVSAFMDIQPINAGHLVVIPNTHAPDLASMDEAVGHRVFAVAQRISAAIYASELKSEGINLFLADGAAAGQEVFHLHLHVFPRYMDDGFGLKFNAAYFERPSREELDSNAEKLRALLS
jgi:histidine triad (HIT) family protein